MNITCKKNRLLALVTHIFKNKNKKRKTGKKKKTLLTKNSGFERVKKHLINSPAVLEELLYFLM